MRITVTINTKEDIRTIHSNFYNDKANRHEIIAFVSETATTREGCIINGKFYTSPAPKNEHALRAKELARERTKKTHQWKQFAKMYF